LEASILAMATAWLPNRRRLLRARAANFAASGLNRQDNDLILDRECGRFTQSCTWRELVERRPARQAATGSKASHGRGLAKEKGLCPA